MTDTLKKLFKITLISILVLVVTMTCFIIWAGVTKQSVPGPEAMNALENIKYNTAVEVEYHDWFIVSTYRRETDSGVDSLGSDLLVH